MIKSIYRFGLKRLTKWHEWRTTLGFKLKYLPLVTLEKKAVVEHNVELKVFWKQGGESFSLHLGNQSRIRHDVIFQGSGQLHIGDRSGIGAFSVIGVNESLVIGNDVMIADSVTIRDSDHRCDRLDIPMAQQGIVSSKVVIEDDCWIGHGAMILKGVTIGQGSIVAAGAVVTQNVAPYSVVGGIPAKVLKRRDEAAKAMA